MDRFKPKNDNERLTLASELGGTAFWGSKLMNAGKFGKIGAGTAALVALLTRNRTDKEQDLVNNRAFLGGASNLLIPGKAMFNLIKRIQGSKPVVEPITPYEYSDKSKSIQKGYDENLAKLTDENRQVIEEADLRHKYEQAVKLMQESARIARSSVPSTGLSQEYSDLTKSLKSNDDDLKREIKDAAKLRKELVKAEKRDKLNVKPYLKELQRG